MEINESFKYMHASPSPSLLAFLLATLRFALLRGSSTLDQHCVIIAALHCTRVAASALLLCSGFLVKQSDWISVRRLSHHSFSEGAVARMSVSWERMSVFCAISEADWKMVWPQLGAYALAYLHIVKIGS